MSEPTPQELERIVAEVVRALAAQAPAAPQAPAVTAETGPVPTRRSRRDDPPPRRGALAWRDRLTHHDDGARPASLPPVAQDSPLPGLKRLADPTGLAALTGATPARIAIGRAGLRYPTDIYLTLRADHAVAKDAVVSTPTPEFLRALGAVELRTQAPDLETFLLYPDKGRVLDEPSLVKLRAEGTRGVDVQIIFADGLSAWAAERNQGLLPALQRELSAAGFSHGKPVWVNRGRIAVADQIGVELGAKATLICLGERPGLGTGDSLSVYLAWNPKIGQDNAEKNCISNVRPAGFSVEQAAAQAVAILRKAREIGQGGLAIGRVA